jgi:hypothetical protein
MAVLVAPKNASLLEHLKASGTRNPESVFEKMVEEEIETLDDLLRINPEKLVDRLCDKFDMKQGSASKVEDYCQQFRGGGGGRSQEDTLYPPVPPVVVATVVDGGGGGGAAEATTIVSVSAFCFLILPNPTDKLTLSELLDLTNKTNRTAQLPLMRLVGEQTPSLRSNSRTLKRGTPRQ